MKGIKYQLKNMRHDKLCIISFLLPVMVGIAINLFSGMNLESINKTAFYIVNNNLSIAAVEWLSSIGKVTAFDSLDLMKKAVNNPASQGIGVLQDGEGLKTLLSGDELQLYRIMGNTLPHLYAEKEKMSLSQITIISTADNIDGLKSLLIVITLVMAMFIGCTFNAMSIIGEKEDGIALLNEVLPMTKKEYIIQKIILGFVGGILSTTIAACICMSIPENQMLPLLLLIVLSTFIAALMGLFIGHFSNGLMVGIAYIKIIMILFLAPPILFFIAVPRGSTMYVLSYLLPSSATFYGLMDLLNGQVQRIGIHIIVLLAHCIIWLFLYVLMTNGRKKGI